MSYWNGTQWVAEMPEMAEAPPVPERPSRAKRLAGALAEGALIAALTFGLIAGSAFAARGGGKGGHGGGGSTTGGGTIALAPLVQDANGDGEPNWGDVVTFTITTSAGAPFVNLQCSQDGSVVLVGWKGYFEGSLDSNWNFGLSSGAWDGGAASCTAYLKVQNSRGTWTTLASTAFAAGA
jgi:hypothetical protein